MRYFRIHKRICTVLSVVILCIGYPGRASTLNSSLTVDIHFDETRIAPGEPLRGSVIVDSSIPAAYPAAFIVQLFRNGTKQKQYLVNIQKVFPGKTEYGLDTFGITGLNSGPDAVGKWRIVMIRHGSEGITAEADVVISADTGGTGSEREQDVDHDRVQREYE